MAQAPMAVPLSAREHDVLSRAADGLTDLAGELPVGSVWRAALLRCARAFSRTLGQRHLR